MKIKRVKQEELSVRETRTRFPWLSRALFAIKLRLLRQERTALASFQRSGNTWLRRLLEDATGMPTGTIYERDKTSGLLDRGLVIKTHVMDSHRYSRALHLIRNPFDCIESYRFWKRDCANGGGVEWNDFVPVQIGRWVKHTRHWMNVDYDVFRLRYEDLHADTAGRLAGVLDWLGCQVPDTRITEAVEHCRIENLRKTAGKEKKEFFRRGEVGQSLDSYSSEQRAYILECAGDLMQSLGYTGCPGDGATVSDSSGGGGSGRR